MSNSSNSLLEGRGHQIKTKNEEQPLNIGINSPFACICNLCNCGEHSCSNFRLTNSYNRCQTRNMSKANSKHKQEIVKGNRNSLGELRFGDKKEEEEEEEGAADDEQVEAFTSESDSADINHQEKCDCYDRERYLTKLKANNNNNSKQSSRNNNNEDDELLHVLVSRPEIASKPRDNIIFEGDMDLKTTFETSYEALAKMRLDHWKKYQELKFNEDAPATSSQVTKSNQDEDKLGKSKRNKSSRNSSRRQLRQEENDLSLDYKYDVVGNSDKEVTKFKYNGEQKIRKSENSPIIMIKNGDISVNNFQNKQEHLNLNYKEKGVVFNNNNNNNYNNNYDDVYVNDDFRKNINTKTMRFAQHAHNDNQQNNKIKPIDFDNCNNKTTPISPNKNDTDDYDLATNCFITKSPTMQHNKAVMNNSGDFDLNQHQNINHQNHSSPKTMERPQTTSTIPRTITKESPYIDPDLSPLIVYNANMNRLDTVGLRKRSKYRPSTTLRSGARGMFGDHEEVIQEQRFEQSQHDKHHHPKESRTIQSMVNDTADNHDTRKQQPLNRSDQMLSARNLKDSKQPNYLVYSDFNLPVDSKRKVQNNVNMIDHIKEQNEVTNKQLLLNRQQNYNNSDVNLNLLEQNMEDLKLMQAEEEAAFEEIKRFNSPIPIQNDAKHEVNNNVMATTTTPSNDNVAVDKNHQTKLSDFNIINRFPVNDAKQSRLQRTCQNQNFDIFGCNYPEEATKNHDYRIKKQIDNKRESPQSKLKTQHKPNNLFRESPDFILTTGKFLYEEAKKQVLAEERHDREVEQETKSASKEANKYQPLLDNINQDGKFVDYAADDNQNMCRVLNLDKNFQFIGSMSGHKYFVERPNLK